MKYLYLIFLAILLPTLSFGQNDYLRTDSSTTFNIKLINDGDLGNAQFCQVKKGDSVIQYTPDEVREFGFKNGRVYISKKIQIADSSKSVFLERLYKGNTSLYFYRGKGIKTFFIQKDSIFIPLPKHDAAKNNYAKQLLNLTKDCPNVLHACKNVSYHKRPLSKLISRYNHCISKPFPHFKYGLLLGYEWNKLIPHNKSENSYVDYFNFNYIGGYTVGLFIDNPISVSPFSFHWELTYSEFGHSYNKRIYNRDFDYVFNCSSLKIPMLLRYSYPSNKIRPFINCGLISVINLKNESLLLDTTPLDSQVTIIEAQEQIKIDKLQLGYGLGGGIECDLNYKNSLFVELRYENIYNPSNQNLLKISGIKCVTGINF